jgi:hypothetical protein
MIARRPAAVAGSFYPDRPTALRAAIAEAFAAATAPPPGRPKALVAPHAGYIYSGSTAATAYASLQPFAAQIRRVVLLGPAHRVAFAGMAVPESSAFATPLGDIAIDAAAAQTALALPGVLASDRPHAQEHSLEVHLPFLQTVLGEFSLLPVVVGDAPPEVVAPLIEAFCDDPGTLLLVSSDLSHFHRYADAQRIDNDTVGRILALQGGIVGEQACGARPINGLLRVARARGWTPRLLAQCNSGDTAGDRQRVVGYASIGFYGNDATRH